MIGPSSGEINISEFAARYERGIAERVARLPSPPGLTVLSDSPYDQTTPTTELNPVGRYIRALEATAGRVGVLPRVLANMTHHAIGSALDKANTDPSTHGVIVTLPLSIDDVADRARRTSELLERIAQNKDVDGLRPGGMPATSEAAVALLESLPSGQRLPTHVNGGNGHVGSGIVRLLQSRGYEVTSSDIGTPPHKRRQLFGRAAVIFSATGQAEGVTLDDFGTSPDAQKLLINIGRGRTEGGKTVGDFSPELLVEAEARGWRYTNNGLGVGRVATLTVNSRAVDFAEMAA